MRFRKTPTRERETYKYYSVTGEVFEYRPDEIGEEMLKLLHRMDDGFTSPSTCMSNSRLPTSGRTAHWIG